MLGQSIQTSTTGDSSGVDPGSSIVPRPAAKVGQNEFDDTSRKACGKILETVSSLRESYLVTPQVATGRCQDLSVTTTRYRVDLVQNVTTTRFRGKTIRAGRLRSGTSVLAQSGLWSSEFEGTTVVKLV